MLVCYFFLYFNDSATTEIDTYVRPFSLHVARPSLSPRLSRTREAQLPDGGHIHDRMRRVLAYWGDRERADTAVLDSGDLAFAGVSKGVFSAFHLPWIVGDSADVPAAATQAIPPEPS